MGWKDLSDKSKRWWISLVIGLIFALPLLSLLITRSSSDTLMFLIMTLYGIPYLIFYLVFRGSTSVILPFLVILISYTLLSFVYLSLLSSIKNRTAKIVIAIVIPLLFFISNFFVWALVIGVP